MIVTIKFQMTILILGLFFALTANAELLENLNVLKTEKNINGIKIKISQIDKAKDNHFYILLDNKDPRKKQIYKHINLKRKLQSQYQLSMDIPSFSAFPFGGIYSSMALKVMGNRAKKERPHKLPPRGF